MLLPHAEPAAQMEVHTSGPVRAGVACGELHAAERRHRGCPCRKRAGHHKAAGTREPPWPCFGEAIAHADRHRGERVARERISDIHGRGFDDGRAGIGDGRRVEVRVLCAAPAATATDRPEEQRHARDGTADEGS